MAKFRRNVFLINKKFQIRFALYVCTWLLALSFIYPLLVYNLFDYFLRYAAQDPNGPPLLELAKTRQEILQLLGLFQVLFLALTFLISIFMSHRIAGPLYKLRQAFAEAKDGALKTDLFFRENDHFRELAKEYNEMMEGIRGQVAGITHRVEQAMTDPSGPRGREELEKALAALRSLQG